MREYTPRLLPVSIHLTAPSCLLGWTTSISSGLFPLARAWRRHHFHVRRIFLSFFRAWKASSSDSVDSIKLCEILACHGWSLHVSLHRFSAHYSTQSFCPAGSTSLPLSMNGVLFEAVFPIGGRYGLVYLTLLSSGVL
jgi:hypothetical protein